MRKATKLLAAIVIALTNIVPAAFANEDKQGKPSFVFVDSEKADFSESNKKRIAEIINSTLAETITLLPTISPDITFNVKVMDRDLSIVNGATGRADRANEIEISLSSMHEGGLTQAIEDGLRVVTFHELHHIARGWLIKENKFGQGIDIAIINEGMADVFAEQQAGHPHGIFPEGADFDAWTKEILDLPVDASYGKWMFMHPDGRMAVGYRTGGWIIKKALEKSGKTILDLTHMPVADIYRLAGYEMKR